VYKTTFSLQCFQRVCAVCACEWVCECLSWLLVLVCLSAFALWSFAWHTNTRGSGNFGIQDTARGRNWHTHPSECHAAAGCGQPNPTDALALCWTEKPDKVVVRGPIQLGAISWFEWRSSRALCGCIESSKMYLNLITIWKGSAYCRQQGYCVEFSESTYSKWNHP